MRFSRRALRIAIFVLPLFVLSVVAYFAIRDSLYGAKEDLTPALEAKLKQILHTEVHVGNVEFEGRDEAIIYDLRIGEIARADQVIVHFDLRRILLDKELPYVANVEVSGAWARVSRNRKGTWNFEDLLKIKQEPAKRQPVGTVTFENVDLQYVDELPPHHPKRIPVRIEASFTNVLGKLQFNSDQAVTWVASGRETTGKLQTCTVRGSYEPQIRRLAISVDANSVSVPVLNQLAPPEVDSTAGVVTGRLTVLQSQLPNKSLQIDYLANVHYSGVSLRSSRSTEPGTSISGVATATGAGFTANLDGVYTGSRIHAEGRVTGYDNPSVSATATGNGLQLQRILSALKMRDRYAVFRNLSAAGAARAGFWGRLDSLQIAAEATGVASGSPLKDVVVPLAVPVHIAMTGPVAHPNVVASGTVPLARYRGVTARNIAMNIALSGSAGAVDFDGTFAGGTASGRTNFTLTGKHSNYSANVAIRGVDISRFKEAQDHKLKGIVDADASIRGRLDQAYPQADATVRVGSLAYGRWTAKSVWSRARILGDTLYLDPAVARDMGGLAIARGWANLKKKTVHFSLEADAVDLARLPFASSGDPRIEGTVYLREGLATGPADNPKLAGVVRGYGLSSGGRLSIDFGILKFSGSKERITLDELSQLWRFPAFTTVAGIIEKPLSDDPRLDLRGEFDRVDLQDIASLAGSEVDASGTAGGNWTALGTAKRPVIVARNVDIRRPTIGRYAFDRITGRAEYTVSEAGGQLNIPEFTAEYGRPTPTGPPEFAIKGHGHLGADRSFALYAEAKSVRLALLGPYIGDYVIPTGTMDVSGDVSGKVKEGKAINLAGSLTAATTGLTLNEADLGDLVGHFTLAGESISGTVRPRTAGGSLRPPGIYVDSFSYNLNDEKLTANGAVEDTQIELIRSAVTRSPFVVRDPNGAIASTLKPLKPLVGSVRTGVQVTGTLQSPITSVDWSNLGVLSVEGQDIQKLTGRLTFKGNLVQLHDATLVADNSTVTALGTYVPNETLEGSLDANEVPLAILRKWFPDQADLQSLTGLADHVHIESKGKPESPSLLASISLKDVKWSDPDKDRHLFGGRTIELSRVGTSTVSIDKGKLNVADLDIKVLEPAQAAVPPTPAPPRAADEVHASGSVDFSWTAPHFPDDAKATINLDIKNQGLALITAFIADSGLTLDGRIETASLTYEGALKKLLQPRQVVAGTGHDQPTLHGVLNITAKRIASATTSTEIHDLDARLRFDRGQNRLYVDNFTATTQIVNSRYVSRKSDPMRISGQLAIHDEPNAPSLSVEAKKLVYAEVPLPGFKSGAAVGEISTDNLTTPTIEVLTIGGTVFDPSLVGSIYLRNTYVKLPDNLEPAAATPPFGLPFSSVNLKIVAEKNVTIAAAQMNATVRSSESEPIILSGGGGEPRLTGSLIIEKGTLQFPTAFFTMQRGGEIALRYPYSPSGISDEKSLGILLNVTATTRITATSFTGTRRRYTITVEARGPINSDAPLAISDPGDLTANPFFNRGLRLTFRADPPDLAPSSAAVQRRVTEVLGGRSAIEGLFAGDLNVGGVVSGLFSQSILPGLFERTGLARTLGLEEFEIEYNQLDAFSVRISRQLFGPVQLSYWRRLSSASRLGAIDRAAWESKLSYRIRSNLHFSWSIDEQKTNAYLLEGVFKF